MFAYNSFIENPKLEGEKIKIADYAKALIKRPKRKRDISGEYVQAYFDCYKGPPERVDMMTQAWDYVHSITR
ncbi:MAG: hypothetical protein GXO64_00630 [Candidatus Micrarchaeota archaeon]|nr:hypothetical protein [Candidatus Micrarchaeota archaeon]